MPRKKSETGFYSYDSKGKYHGKDYFTDLFSHSTSFKVTSVSGYSPVLNDKGKVRFLKDASGNKLGVDVLKNPKSKRKSRDFVDMSTPLQNAQSKYTPKQIETLARKGHLYIPLKSGKRFDEFTKKKEESERKRKESETRQISNTVSKLRDLSYYALPPGRRTSASGRVYYERRSNRSDTPNERLSFIQDKQKDPKSYREWRESYLKKKKARQNQRR